VVIGTGLMAPGIAAACASTGASVRVVGRDPDRAAAAAAFAREHADSPAITSGPIEPPAVAAADLVVESIVEDLDAKTELFRRIEGWIPGETVVATNTSSLRIGDLAGALRRPQRFIGLHFLNPAHITTVVEVIPGPDTEQRTTVWLADFSRRMGKAPLVVRRDAPGFIWNRLQFALLRECLHLLEEGVADVEAIDAAVSDGLAPRWTASGPLATADLGGIRTFATVASELYPSLCNDVAPPQSFVARGERGERFYAWTADSERMVAHLREEHLRESRSVIEQRRGAMPAAEQAEAAEGPEG
jgi:3-hydroxybutyryl-CoA dehydrogenase